MTDDLSRREFLDRVGAASFVAALPEAVPPGATGAATHNPFLTIPAGSTPSLGATNDPGAYAVPSGIFGLAKSKNAGCAFISGSGA
jgi:hypothetical protein